MRTNNTSNLYSRLYTRDQYLVYHSPACVRALGHRMGPNRMRRHQRANRQFWRSMQGTLANMGYLTTKGTQ